MADGKPTHTFPRSLDFDPSVKHFIDRHDADRVGAEPKRNAVDQLVFIEHILRYVGIVRHGRCLVRHQPLPKVLGIPGNEHELHVFRVQVFPNHPVDIVKRQFIESGTHVIGEFIGLVILTVQRIAELSRLAIRQQTDKLAEICPRRLEV